MAALIAGSAGLLAIFTGTQLSRPYVSNDKHGPVHAQPDTYPAQRAKPASAVSDSGASSPIAARDLQLERAPSVLDVLESKWFGSVESSGNSSHFHDSAASMSPQERRQRILDLENSAHGGSAVAPSGAATSAAAAAAACGSAAGAPGSNSHSSGSSHASSASRQIACSVNGGSAHRPRPPPMPHMSVSEPDTPDWMDRASMTGNLSTMDSATSTQLARASSSGDLRTAGSDASESDETLRGGQAAAAALQQQLSREAPPPSALFGTWARRQKHFPRSQPPNANADGTGGTIADPGAEAGGAARRQRLEPVQAPHQQVAAEAAAKCAAEAAANDADDDDRVREHAWRWRFGRRWAAEQAKQFDPDYGKQAGDEEDWDEALGYLGAHGAGGIQLQIGRTISVEKTLGKASLHRDGSGTSSFMLDGESLQDEGMLSRESSDYGATRSLGAMARKAQELLKHQKEIDRNVARQWGDAPAAGASWAGQFLPAVTIDMHGRFPFVLLRAVDPTGMHKLLVRGKYGCNHVQLLKAAKQEAAQQSATRQVPSATLAIIGSGVMTWSNDRDRCVNVSDGCVVKGADGTVRSNGDAARLAGALTSCSLPMNHKVTVDGQRLM